MIAALLLIPSKLMTETVSLYSLFNQPINLPSNVWRAFKGFLLFFIVCTATQTLCHSVLIALQALGVVYPGYKLSCLLESVFYLFGFERAVCVSLFRCFVWSMPIIMQCVCQD